MGRPSGLMSGRALECFQHSKAVLLTTEDADAQGIARTSRLQPHRASSQGRLEWAFFQGYLFTGQFRGYFRGTNFTDYYESYLGFSGFGVQGIGFSGLRGLRGL